MSARKSLALEEKLFALREGDSVYQWHSLDDRRACILCERVFSGRQVEVSISPAGQIRLHCPSEGCAGTPNEWVHPGNPLISAKAWHDWERILGEEESTRGKSALAHATL